MKNNCFMYEHSNQKPYIQRVVQQHRIVEVVLNAVKDYIKQVFMDAWKL